jgi:signal peptidase I
VTRSQDGEEDLPREREEAVDGGRATHRAKAKKEKKKGSFWKELPILIVIALVLTFLIQTFIARVYVIPSGSMEQTLNGCPGCTGDRILVDKMVYRFSDIEPGDVVVFKGPSGWEENEFQTQPSSNVFVHWIRQFGSALGVAKPDEYDLVKRVIAVAGQTVSCCDSKNRVVVDGKPLNEPYIYWEKGTPHKQAQFKPVKIPAGGMWMMGDNRNNSFDSRYQNNAQSDPSRGVVPQANAIGKARVIIWPPSRWQGVRNQDPHTVSMQAPAWQQGLPLGVGFAFAFPVYWTGKKVRGAVRRGEKK